MKHIHIKTYLILCMVMVSLLHLFSCKKFLDAKPEKELAIPSALKDLQALLDNHDRINDYYPCLGQVGTDEFYVEDAELEKANPENQQAYRWGADIYNGQFTDDWGYLYRGIYIANIVLEQVDKIDKTTFNAAAFNNVKGSALFFRGNSFMLGLWVWAQAYDKPSADTDLGIPLRLSSDYNEPSYRATIHESYQQVIKDLTEAAHLLPQYSLHPMRPSRIAALGLLARIHLSMRQYDSCLKYTNLALEAGLPLMDFNEVNPSPARPFQKFNPEVLFHGRCFTTYTTVYSNSRIRVDTILYGSYDDNDLRKTLYFRTNPDGSHGYRGSFDNSVYTFGGLTTAELYLMQAECLARKGAREEALSTLNTVLGNRWVTDTFTPLTAENADQALDLVLAERKKDLIFMNLRWMDIKRLNKEGRNIILRRKINGEIVELLPNENRYAFPIPPAIIKLTGMPQNPR